MNLALFQLQSLIAGYLTQVRRSESDKEHNINLNQFRHSLPEDQSGVDVHHIWNTVRTAVSEQPGFEVVEELVVGSFSFAKYLMWKDLKDRMDDLKENPFVEHLVDHPQDAYSQDSSFVSTGSVDHKIDPEKVFTPLNCDSSQLVAVEASGRPQDFVLEGPPGTGKSETIANMICHNLALGRKVLFVAEKMAALHVVYRRMEKVGLDHLCLELHSNKANKKAVLEQLKSATDKREIAESEGWIESVQTLKKQRKSLNDYVQALHEKCTYGVSAREVIAREALYRDRHTLSLAWVFDMGSAPIKSAEELESMLETVKHTAIAYQDISELDPKQFRILKARQWSNAWQNQVLDCLKRYQAAIQPLPSHATALASSFNLSIDDYCIDSLSKINSLASLVECAENESFSFLLKKGAKSSLENLTTLSKIKTEFDEQLISIGNNASAEVLSNTPINEWSAVYEESRGSWLKSFFAKIKINKAAKQLGYTKFSSLDVIPKIQSAKTLQDELSSISGLFEEDNIWQGWDTPSHELANASQKYTETYQSITEVLGLTDDPAELLSALKSKLGG